MEIYKALIRQEMCIRDRNYYVGARAFGDLKVPIYKAFGDIYKVPVK